MTSFVMQGALREEYVSKVTDLINSRNRGWRPLVRAMALPMIWDNFAILEEIAPLRPTQAFTCSVDFCRCSAGKKPSKTRSFFILLAHN